MRWVGWILAALLLVGWTAAELPPVVPPTQSWSSDLWRRTRHGWERAEWLLPKPVPSPLWLHPVALAGLQIAASVVALRTVSRRPSPDPSPAA